jgi:hypothetical protein
MKATIDETKSTTLQEKERNGKTVRLRHSTTHKSRAPLCETHRQQGFCLVLRYPYPPEPTSGPAIAFDVVLAHLASYWRRHRVVSENTALWLEDWWWCFETEILVFQSRATYEPIKSQQPDPASRFGRLAEQRQLHNATQATNRPTA